MLFLHQKRNHLEIAYQVKDRSRISSHVKMPDNTPLNIVKQRRRYRLNFRDMLLEPSKGIGTCPKRISESRASGNHLLRSNTSNLENDPGVDDANQMTIAAPFNSNLPYLFEEDQQPINNPAADLEATKIKQTSRSTRKMPRKSPEMADDKKTSASKGSEDQPYIKNPSGDFKSIKISESTRNILKICPIRPDDKRNSALRHLEDKEFIKNTSEGFESMKNTQISQPTTRTLKTNHDSVDQDRTFWEAVKEASFKYTVKVGAYVGFVYKGCKSLVSFVFVHATHGMKYILYGNTSTGISSTRASLNSSSENLLTVRNSYNAELV